MSARRYMTDGALFTVFYQTVLYERSIDFIMNLYDVVELTIDLPEHGLVKGQTGAILMIYNEYDCEVEFCNNEGITLFLGALPMDCLRIVNKHNF